MQAPRSLRVSLPALLGGLDGRAGAEEDSGLAAGPSGVARKLVPRFRHRFGSRARRRCFKGASPLALVASESREDARHEIWDIFFA